LQLTTGLRNAGAGTAIFLPPINDEVPEEDGEAHEGSAEDEIEDNHGSSSTVTLACSQSRVS